MAVLTRSLASVFQTARCVTELLGRSRWRNLVIAFLLVGGWTLPSVAPPNGVIWGFTGFWNPEFYWRYVYYGNYGFFSKGVVVEDTWEWTHGHSWIVGQWIEGCAISLSVPVFGSLILFARPAKGFVFIRVFIAMFCGFGRVCIWLLWLRPFAGEWWWPRMNWVLLSTLLLFSAFMIWSWERNKLHHPLERVQIWGADSLLIYPAWILALELTQGLCPSVGWFMTFAGCGMLGRSARKVHLCDGQ